MDNKLSDKINTSDEKIFLQNETLKQKDIDLTDVRQGIIWSQILDRPRSKNPYFTSGEYKHRI